MEDYKRKYEAALEAAKKWFNSPNITAFEQSCIRNIFSELAESEDEKIRKALIKAVISIKKDESPWFVSDKETCDKVLAWLEKGEQKINNNQFTPEQASILDKHIDKLLEQKPVWSEEDETALCDVLWCCKQARTTVKDENDMGNIWYAEKWLKSLKKRYTWKPSDNEMEALSNALSLVKSCGEECSFALITLYEQLKKLRKELL